MGRRHLFRFVLRFSIALLGLTCCYRLTRDAARAGISRLFSATAIIQSRIEPANEAVRLAPNDPEAHYTRALALVNLERLNDAVAELEQATRLRSHHYYEWLDLGVTLDRLGDQTGADAALKESVRLAPAFSQPRWQLGSLFYRQARYEEGFAELRLAAKSNPSLGQGLLDLAWAAADGDVGKIEAWVQPQSRRQHLELASFLARHGKGTDAARKVKDAGEPGDEGERALMHQTISDLLAAQQFSEAYVAWAATHSSGDGNSTKGPAQLLNENFMEPIMQNDPGFGWQLLDAAKAGVSIDLSGPGPGARSVRVEFGGDSAPEIHQLVLLQPNTRYSLSFMARAEGLVTGGPPVIVALAADSKPVKILSQSKPLSPGTREWNGYQVEFSTDEKTSAVIIALQRLSCSQSPCPIFGKLWLSKFALARN
jgi:tetratricopeptide (TPR) repeat protein